MRSDYAVVCLITIQHIGPTVHAEANNLLGCPLGYIISMRFKRGEDPS